MHLHAAASGLDRYYNPLPPGTRGITVEWTGGNTRRLREAGLTELHALQSIAMAIRTFLEDVKEHEHEHTSRHWCFKVAVSQDNTAGELPLSDVLRVQVWPVSSGGSVRLPSFNDPRKAYLVRAPAVDHPNGIHASLWNELAEPELDGQSGGARTSVAFRWHWFDSTRYPPRTAQDKKRRVLQAYEKDVVLLTSESEYKPSADYIFVTFFAQEPRAPR
ncbi:uncharacterized protein RHOBADRAFT_51265 [Rhodotorula graminis WP1]|uniref:Uncharacterized protein n=1 Tax=Rhodotorula graminis (strain WP1) TaxID=578459 RepID=A0A194S9Z7_RHOGW|nr:uncharacterized protein RHOBADRAFT_51265 [Rhodotorula graminis WP1]KPV77409.1 hypothetical protein RHOBADRAFT_51265 [Rhodotorula graminis WP1]